MLICHPERCLQKKDEMRAGAGNRMKSVDEDVVSMCRAHEGGDVETVRNLLNARPELEHMAPDSTWLHRASKAGHIGLVDFWLERGWDINCDMSGSSKADGLLTPLHVAKDAAMTRHLVSRGALIDAWNRWSGTPLHCAVVGALEVSQRGRRRSTPDSQGDQIRALLAAGADPSLGDGDGRTPLAFAIFLRRKLAAQVLREAGAPKKARLPRPKKPDTLDLRKDFADIYSYLAERVRNFDPVTHDGPGGPGKVKMIVVGFEFAQGGWVAAVFDTRPDAEADGEWTSQIEDNMLERPHWREASEANAEQPPTLLLPDGSESVLPRSSELATPLGDLLKAVLLKACADGMFAPLPKAAGCELAVENFDGYYTWPADEARGEENLA
jgi:ankyrin repeat protein